MTQNFWFQLRTAIYFDMGVIMDSGRNGQRCRDGRKDSWSDVTSGNYAAQYYTYPNKGIAMEIL